MNMEVNIIVNSNYLNNLSLMIALNTCINMSKKNTLIAQFTQVKMKSIFWNIKEKCNIPFSKQVQTVMVLNIF